MFPTTRQIGNGSSTSDITTHKQDARPIDSNGECMMAERLGKPSAYTVVGLVMSTFPLDIMMTSQYAPAVCPVAAEKVTCERV